MSFVFPDGFVWGAATAAHQVEGNNTASDFWLLEHTPGSIFAEPSGDACDHFHRYAADVGLLAQLGFGAYRSSIEWARIEPAEGGFGRSVGLYGATEQGRTSTATAARASYTPGRRRDALLEARGPIRWRRYCSWKTMR